MRKSKTHLSLEDFIDFRSKIIDISATPVYTLKKEEPVKRFAELSLQGKGRVIVRDRRGRPTGLITNRELLDFLGGGLKHRLYSKQKWKTRVESIADKSVVPLERDMNVEDALEFFRKYGKGLHPVVDEERIVGFISEMDFIRHINKPVGISVENIMTTKPIIINEDVSLHEAAKMLCRGGFRKLPVVKNGIFRGIITPHDIVSHVIKNLGKLKRDCTPIKDVMKTNVITVKPNNDIYEAVRIMKRKRIGFLPVVDDTELVGILTQRDVLEI